MLFQFHCAKCHGPEGHGDPEAMATQRPPPRDFASRPWRLEVSEDSIRRVTAAGILGTAMPSHRAALSDQDLDALVTYVYRLAMRDPISAPSRSPLEAAMDNAGFVPEPAPRDAPGLELVDALGNRRSLADERGRIVLLNFWGITCEHCLAGMPKIQALADRWESRGLAVLSICADADDVAQAQELVTRVSPSAQIWFDETGLANSQFGVNVLPTFYVVDPAGQLIASASGMKEWDSAAIERLIEALVAGEKLGLRRSIEELIGG
jgi:thiol-disulfide isomerase/thioredoxin